MFIAAWVSLARLVQHRGIYHKTVIVRKISTGDDGTLLLGSFDVISGPGKALGFVFAVIFRLDSQSTCLSSKTETKPVEKTKEVKTRVVITVGVQLLLLLLRHNNPQHRVVPVQVERHISPSWLVLLPNPAFSHCLGKAC